MKIAYMNTKDNTYIMFNVETQKMYRNFDEIVFHFLSYARDVTKANKSTTQKVELFLQCGAGILGRNHRNRYGGFRDLFFEKMRH